jgi:hypothetical protein
MSRLAVTVAFLAGAALVAVCFVAYSPSVSPSGPSAQPSLAAKKTELKSFVRKQQRTGIRMSGARMKSSERMTMLPEIHFGMTTVSTSHLAEGNRGLEWNYGQNYAEPNSKALANGWITGSNTLHSGGKGMFGIWGVKENAVHPSAGMCTPECR